MKHMIWTSDDLLNEAAKEDFDAKEDVTEDEYRDTYKDMD